MKNHHFQCCWKALGINCVKEEGHTQWYSGQQKTTGFSPVPDRVCVELILFTLSTQKREGIWVSRNSQVSFFFLSQNLILCPVFHPGRFNKQTNFQRLDQCRMVRAQMKLQSNISKAIRAVSELELDGKTRAPLTKKLWLHPHTNSFLGLFSKPVFLFFICPLFCFVFQILHLLYPNVDIWWRRLQKTGGQMRRYITGSEHNIIFVALDVYQCHTNKHRLMSEWGFQNPIPLTKFQR